MADASWPTLLQLLDELLDAPAAVRAERLRALAVESPAAAEELERLLAADGAAGGLLDAGLGALAGEAPAEADDEEDLSGAEAGPYRLAKRIGRGGMGTVYAAARADGLYDQRVAVKVLAGLASPDLLRRFARERAILAALAHPNIARLLDAGTLRGRPFLVMEFVDGVSIVEHCAAVGADVPARLRLFLQVCDAVAFAHRHLVVHRDLKPSNVLVDAHGAVKLLDFGIASLLDPRGTAGATMTRRLFTPAYAAPEQVLGEQVTTAADVYAMGALLHELLTGRPPDPVWTGERRASGLRGDLDAIVATALRREPEQRYHSVEALADDVQRHLEAQPVLARGPDRAYRARLFVRRHRAALLAAAVAVAALVGGLSAALVQAHAARSEARRANTLRTFLTFALKREVLAHPGPDGHGPPVGDLFARGLASVDDDFGDEPASVAELDSIAGEIFRMTGAPARAVAAFRAALARKQALYPAGDARLWMARLDLANALITYGRVAGAAEALALCRALDAESDRVDEEDREGLLVVYSRAATLAGDLALARSLGLRQWELERRERGRGTPRRPLALSRLAEVAYRGGHLREALDWMARDATVELGDRSRVAARTAYMALERAYVEQQRGDLAAASASYAASRAGLRGRAGWPMAYIDCGQGLLLVEEGEVAEGRALLLTPAVAAARADDPMSIGFGAPGTPCPALAAWVRGDAAAMAAELASPSARADGVSPLAQADRDLLLAEALLGAGRASEALARADAAARARDQSPELLPWRRAEAHLLRGLVLARLGRDGEGRAEIARAAPVVRAAVPRHRLLAPAS